MRKELLTPENAHLVRDFDCGNEPYAIEVSNWIKSALSAGGEVWTAIKAGALVWLYLTDQGELIGFGAIYPQEIILDAPQQPFGGLLTIAYYGLRKEFRKQPEGPWQDYYSRQIFRDLIQEARRHPALGKKLALYVNTTNAGAIRLYSDPEFGFKKVGTWEGDDCMVKDM
jgi:ribosomal protein S18 acetylase RimI-like enzyme